MTSSRTPKRYRSRMLRAGQTGLLLLTLAWGVSSAIATEAANEILDAWMIEKLSDSATLGESRRLEIVNELGDVRCRLSSDDQILVSAAIQRHEDDPHEAEVRIDRNTDRTRIETVFAASQSFDPSLLAEGMEKRRIDLTVLIPLGARLEIRTNKGLIEAKGLESDVTATSTSGDVVVSILGSLRARSEHGDISATFKKTDWKDLPELETLTGDITVWLPPDASTEIRAETIGLMTTDYSIEIESDARGEKKTATAKLGKGKGRLSIFSTKGNISILRQRG